MYMYLKIIFSLFSSIQCNCPHNVTMASVDRVTIVKDKDTHRSKGVAFVLFLDRDGAQNCVRSLDNTEVIMIKLSLIIYYCRLM